MTLVLAVLLSAVAPSKAPAYTGTRLEQGQKAFADGQFDVALKVLDEAAVAEKDLGVLEKVQLLRGQCFAARQDFSRAEEAFAAALEANPETSLDPGRVDPAVVKLLESIRTRASGTLLVRSSPEGATVRVDGNEVGTAPVTVSSAIGRRRVEAVWGDDRQGSLEVIVRPRRDTYVEWILKEKTVEVIVEKRVEVPVTPPTPVEPTVRAVRPYLAARIGADLNAGPEPGVDFALGVDLFRYLSVGVFIRPYRYTYFIPRIAGMWPALDVLILFLELEGDIRIGRLGLGLGGSVGAEYQVLPWLRAFAQAGGKGFAVNNGFVVDVRFFLAGGLKLIVP